MIKIVLSALVLVHALITGPLLVQCIAVDGHALTEMLGHDPCHLQSGTPHSGLAARAVVDPCADVILGHAGLVQPGLHAPAPESSSGPAVDQICPPRPSGRDTVPPAWKPLRENAFPRLEFSLRV